jgi:hypothetical protein
MTTRKPRRAIFRKRKLAPADLAAQRDHDTAAFIKSVAKGEHQKYGQLYWLTGDGLFIWLGYQSYRKLDLPIPEDILLKFDAIASRLSKAGGSKEIADALEMGKKKGGAVGGRRTKATERQHDIISWVHLMLRAEYGYSKGKAFESAAKRFSTRIPRVKTLYYAWEKKIKQFEEKQKR